MPTKYPHKSNFDHLNYGLPKSDQSRLSYLIEILWKVISSIFIFGCCFYTIRYKPLSDWLKYPAMLGIPLCLLFIFSILIGWLRTPPKDRSNPLPSMIAGTVSGIAIAVLVYSAIAVFTDLILYLLRAVYLGPVKIAGIGIGTFFVGLSFFYFRLKFRFVYGLSEALLGAVVAAHQMWDRQRLGGESWEPSVLLGLLTAGVYLVVRGLDNMHTAITKDLDDPIARILRAMMEPVGPSDMKLFRLLIKRQHNMDAILNEQYDQSDNSFFRKCVVRTKQFWVIANRPLGYFDDKNPK